MCRVHGAGCMVQGVGCEGSGCSPAKGAGARADEEGRPVRARIEETPCTSKCLISALFIMAYISVLSSWCMLVVSWCMLVCYWCMLAFFLVFD